MDEAVDIMGRLQLGRNFEKAEVDQIVVFLLPAIKNIMYNLTLSKCKENPVAEFAHLLKIIHPKGMKADGTD